MNQVNKPGQSVLYLACLNGHLAVAELLLDRGADMDMADTTEWGDTPHTISSRQSHKDMVQLLLDRGVSVNQVNKQGESCLYKACYFGHLEVAELLLEQ